MSKTSDQNTDLIRRLQEMQTEHFLISNLTKDLSIVLDKDRFSIVFNTSLKSEFKCNEIAIVRNKGNQNDLFYSSLNIQNSSVNNHSYYEKCTDSPEPLIFDLKELPDSLPSLFTDAKSSGMRTAVGFCLPNFHENINIIFLFYRNFISSEGFPERVLKGISTQLSITIRNIDLTERFKNLRTSDLHPKKETEAEESPKPNKGFHGIIGESRIMKDIFEQISQVALSQSNVIIYGETGTGKELIAEAIHQLSDVSQKQMIRVNCAAIPSNLIESELFGHEKGSFTGATEQRKGKFELAQNSTIFLDEIGELPLELQGRLLRVLQEKEVERVGGNKRIKINARVITATNRNLEREVAEGKFRNDLFYRLTVFPINLPTLCERKEDIPLLASFFLEKLSVKTGKKISGFSQKAMDKMMQNQWQGNIRELENTVERAMLIAKDKIIRDINLPKSISVSDPIQNFVVKTLKEAEKDHILKAIQHCNGKIFGDNGAAKVLELPPTTLISKMKKLGIEKKYHFNDSE